MYLLVDAAGTLQRLGDVYPRSCAPQLSYHAWNLAIVASPARFAALLESLTAPARTGFGIRTDSSVVWILAPPAESPDPSSGPAATPDTLGGHTPEHPVQVAVNRPGVDHLLAGAVGLELGQPPFVKAFGYLAGL